MAGKVNVSLIQQFLQLFQFRLPVCRNLCHTLRIAAENITDAIVLYLPQFLIEKLHLKNDAALSRALEVAPPVISKIRHRRLPVGASLLIRMHEVSELSIRELRELMGDRREKFRISDKQFKPKPGVPATAQAE